MIQYISSLQGVLTRYWGDQAMQWLFYIALVIIFFLENDRMRKQVFFYLPLVVYLFLISPAYITVGTHIWQEETFAYLCRQFSLIPVFLVIAYAMVLIIKTVTGKKKALILLGGCLIIVLFGSNLVYINGDYSFEKSENIYKLPNDLISVCDYMNEEDEDPVVAIQTDLSVMIRQYLHSAHLLVGFRAYNDPLSNELASEEPDVRFIMKTMEELGGEFVIVGNEESIRQAFLDEGYTPSYETSSYVVYQCNNYF